MSSYSKVPVSVFVLRTVLLFYLFYHWFLHFREYLSPLGIGFVFLFGVALAWIIHSSRLRTFSALILIGTIPLLLYPLLTRLFLLGGTLYTGTYGDILALQIDRYFFLTILPLEIVTLTTVLFLRFPSYASLEPALHGLFLIALFFSEGPFRLHLYTHPLYLALSVSGFILAETVLLALLSSKSPVALSRIIRTVPYILLLFVALYLGYERYTLSSLQARGGLLKAELFRFDFTNYLTLETEIRQTKDLVLLYRRSEPIDRYLLKRYLLEGYSPGRGFYKDPGSPDPPSIEAVPVESRSLPVREIKGRQEIVQDIYLTNLDPNALVSLDYPTRVIPFRVWPHASFSRIYRVEAQALSILPLELSEVEGPGMTPNAVAYYTEYGKDMRIRELAEEITRGIPTYYDRVQTINDYLKYEYFYSLKPGKAPDGDQLGYFLFSSRKGYCSYFAFSMALLCRSLGIPSRVVIGFFIDPETEVLGYYPVRSDMAHAWVEVYFAGYGWVDFDPTSRTPAAGETYIPSGGIPRETLSSLLKELFSHTLEPDSPENPPALVSPSESQPHRHTGLNWVLGYFFLFGFMSFVIFILFYRFWYVLKAHWKKDPREKVCYAFLALLQDCTANGFKMDPEETVGTAFIKFIHSLKFSGEGAELFYLYQQARFGPTFTSLECAKFFYLLNLFRKTLYEEKGGMTHFTTVLHPRSFRRFPG
ncbi:MAG TPA: transglutaminase domain-containing protein [Spirochaetales bacterium]|nr:transglutaminase domain-containing protein [Spirochaetales bacterium]